MIQITDLQAELSAIPTITKSKSVKTNVTLGDIQNVSTKTMPGKSKSKIPMSLMPNWSRVLPYKELPKGSGVVFHKKKAFGLTRRFCNIGFHPGLDSTGSMKKEDKLSPGMYTYDSVKCPRRKEQASIWKRQVDSQAFSENLGFSKPHILAYRNFMSKHLGPGSHELSETRKKIVSSCNNTGFGTQKRFFHYDDNTPAPGTYSVNAVPDSRTFSKATTSWNRTQRFRDLDKVWYLSPNRYEVSDPGSMETLTKKVVSKRGPYDLFTGPRTDENVFNKFSSGKSCSPDKIYTLMVDLEYLLHHQNNTRKGKFLRDKRFPAKPTVRMMLQDLSLCYHDPKDPSPNHYNVVIDSIKKLPPSIHAFGITGPDKRATLKWNIAPGPGRYHVDHPKCGHSKNGTWVFTSKTKRNEYKEVTYNAF